MKINYDWLKYLFTLLVIILCPVNILFIWVISIEPVEKYSEIISNIILK